MAFRPGSSVGRLGEDLACRFLMKQGFSIVERNYWKKWGEIDVIVEKNDRLHFIEVKAVTRPNLDDVAHETVYRPEENVHFAKIQRLRRVIQTYVAERGREMGDWQFDIAAVYIDPERKKAKVSLLGNVIL